MTEETKTKSEAEMAAEANAFVEATIQNMPDMLTPKHMMRVVGEIVTAFHDNEGEALEFLNLCARAIVAYYRFADGADPSDETVH